MISEKELFQALAQRHSPEYQANFSQSKVIILGLGGLGSHIATLLARAGVGQASAGGFLHLVDFDQVDLSNIHRQNYKLSQIGQDKTQALKESLLEINPYLSILTTTEKMTENAMEKLFPTGDVVCEAFDNPETKALVVDLFFRGKQPHQCLFSASGMAGFGAGNDIVCRKISPQFYLFGDGKSDVAKEHTLIATRVSLCASAQAHGILRHLAQLEDKPTA